jgi:uncharacterized membrane protein YkvA (DUF1232 family)
VKKDFKGYYDFLKEEMKRYKGGFENFILYVPDFFKLLCDLLGEDIDIEDRRKINSALAYFVVPTDVIPEEIYGPMGYVDDIYLCARVLKDLQEKYGAEFLKKFWNCDEDFEEVLKVTYEKSLEILEKKGVVDEILKYSGLK